MGVGSSAPRSEPKPAPVPRSSGTRSSSSTSSLDIDREARELEDLLNVAKDRSTNVGSRPTQTSQPAPSFPGTTKPVPPSSTSDWTRPAPSNPAPTRPTPNPFPTQSAPTIQPPQQPKLNPRPPEAATPNDRALLLVRAMINAAKSDGSISPEEQDQILGQFQSASHEIIQFLRQEFAQPLDVREFAWSVPLGLEQQVYMMSLSAINLDHPAEAEYLRNLAHGLRLMPEMCNQIHQRLGVQSIY